jgi:hypothetical protein
LVNETTALLQQAKMDIVLLHSSLSTFDESLAGLGKALERGTGEEIQSIKGYVKELRPFVQELTDRLAKDIGYKKWRTAGEIETKWLVNATRCRCVIGVDTM